MTILSCSGAKSLANRLFVLFIFTRLFFTMIAYFLMDKQVYDILFGMIKTLVGFGKQE